MMVDSDLNREFLRSSGLKEVSFDLYKDKFSTALFSFDENGISIDVVLKNPEYWNKLQTLWIFLKENPGIFRKKIWKKSGLTKEEISKNIETLMEFM